MVVVIVKGALLGWARGGAAVLGTTGQQPTQKRESSCFDINRRAKGKEGGKGRKKGGEKRCEV
jgi:hypothetical protein